MSKFEDIKNSLSPENIDKIKEIVSKKFDTISDEIAEQHESLKGKASEIASDIRKNFSDENLSHYKEEASAKLNDFKDDFLNMDLDTKANEATTAAKGICGKLKNLFGNKDA
ncbi:hypothetical protein [Solitalea koreensis]|uniref:Uncharacterized protein n=1 Tax=Solitalea koreensis TaxID=543615 RepID=A0A521ALA4_9SPHI|nr:hypothetical protein [Solitalea koreensis]SMO35585.1 hypothetical protein SAMN06265350_101216 [Solitalea koreensis]